MSTETKSSTPITMSAEHEADIRMKPASPTGYNVTVLLAELDATRVAHAETQERLEQAQRALKPFADCNRGWVERGERVEIRFDWLQHAEDALVAIEANTKALRTKPECGQPEVMERVGDSPMQILYDDPVWMAAYYKAQAEDWKRLYETQRDGTAPAGQPDARFVRVVGAVIEQDGFVRIFRRGGNDSYTGKWEFPGGKVESGESLPDALKRELREEFAVDSEIGPELDHYLYQYPNRSPIDLTFFSVKMLGAPDFLEHTESAWVKPEQLAEYDLINGDMKFVATRYVAARQNDELRSQLEGCEFRAQTSHEVASYHIEENNKLKAQLSTTRYEVESLRLETSLKQQRHAEVLSELQTTREIARELAALLNQAAGFTKLVQQTGSVPRWNHPDGDSSVQINGVPELVAQAEGLLAKARAAGLLDTPSTVAQ